MFYPKDFKKRARELYPEWNELHELLEKGDEFAGSYLELGTRGALSIDTILAATSLEELQKKAKIEQEKTELYKSWLKLDNEQNSH